ncbi:unnamed protein product [Ranitomeya imitator]|uniref:Uncharacterized protein n=1 Tax=Ranitomeya imitator TaxID=111125 RepID=A0ABN9LFP6_9NEOB|nr:unnamed protein product [Ranitomeya imitator]
MILEKVFSLPSSSQYTRCTLAVEDTGCPMLAPWMSSRAHFTLRLAVLSPITKLMASIKLDFPELTKKQFITSAKTGTKKKYRLLDFCRFFGSLVSSLPLRRQLREDQWGTPPVERGGGGSARMRRHSYRKYPTPSNRVLGFQGDVMLLSERREKGDMFEQDRAEAAVLQRRRHAEQQRQSRVFDTRARTIGVDSEALDSQVHDKKIQKEIEDKRQEAFDAQMVQNDQTLRLLDQRQKDDIRNLNAAINEFRLQYQKKEDRREYDLYDPLALKKDLPPRVSDDDPRCGVSGVQRLMGEDLTEKIRKKRTAKAAPRMVPPAAARVGQSLGGPEVCR